MCGILGVVKGSSTFKTWDVDLRVWAESIEHRGPDEFGKFENEHIALGSQRLSIIDISHGQQPYFSESKNVVAVFNGQIYNYNKCIINIIYNISIFKKKKRTLNTKSNNTIKYISNMEN